MTSSIKIPSRGSKHTNDIKRKLIADYVVLGNLQKASDCNGISRDTAYCWVNSDWGQALINNVQAQKSIEIDAAMTKIIDNAANHVIESLEHGDEKLDKDNNIIRLRMDGKAAATVMGIAFDKRQIMRNLPTAINQSIDNKALAKLQQQFQQLSKQSKVIEGEVISDD